jgi:hypothetical protein
MTKRSSFFVTLERAGRIVARAQREREAANRRHERERLRGQREALRREQVRERLRVQQHYVSRQDESQAMTAEVAAQVVALRSILVSRNRPTREGPATASGLARKPILRELDLVTPYSS